MTVRKTLQIGNTIIRGKARVVTKIDSLIVKKTIKDLVDSMRKENLVGMAAPQIGSTMRIFVTEVRKTTYRKNISEPDRLRIFINPRIIHASKKLVDGYEGCGSVATALLFGPVKRAHLITVAAYDEKGSYFETKAEGFLARIIQHEIDHLNGILFIDWVTDTKKLLGKDEYIAMKKS